jgi:hypothetical protein
VTPLTIRRDERPLLIGERCPCRVWGDGGSGGTEGDGAGRGGAVYGSRETGGAGGPGGESLVVVWEHM